LDTKLWKAATSAVEEASVATARERAEVETEVVQSNMLARGLGIIRVEA
jgi:hypothetical protein